MRSEEDHSINFAQAAKKFEIEERLMAAIECHRNGRLLEAAEIYKNILEHNKNHLVALNNYSLLLPDAEALEFLKIALNMDPTYMDALINASVRWMNLGNDEEAKRLVAVVLQNNPEDTRATQILARLSNKKSAIAISEEIKAIEYSVIIPTHRRAKLLERAIASIKQQKARGGVEIVVVSDCEDKGTDDVCRELLGVSDVYVRRSGKNGPSESRNLALKIAKGKIILFLDDDDSWHPDLLTSLDACSELQKGRPVYFNCTVVKETRKSSGPEVLSEKFLDMAGRLTEDVFVKNQVHMSCFAIPKFLLINLEFDPHMRAYEDWDFLLSIFEKTMPVHIPVLGSKVYEVDDGTTDRRGSSEPANNFNAVIDYLYVYRRHAASEHIRKKRAAFLQAAGLMLPSDLL